MAHSSFDGQELYCEDCGKYWIFTATEQAFFAKKDFEQPKRCVECRARRRETLRGTPRQMYAAVCSDCLIETEVPFEPKSGREIYCRPCYAKRVLAVGAR